jgi:hypothetical protein
MTRKGFLAAVLALPLAVAGFVYGQTLKQRQSDQPQQPEAEGFICPVTGEELPCPNCCPLNK